MLYFLYLMSFLWMMIGFCLLTIPEFIRKAYLRKIGNIDKLKLLSIVPLVVGILFFLSTEYLLIDTFGYAMGVLAIFKGLSLLSTKKERMRQILNWWVEAPSECLRMSGILLLSLALILLSLVR